MFGIIDRYVGKTVLSVMLICLTALSALTVIITFIDMTRHLGKGDIDFLFLLYYSLMLLPSRLVYLFPVSLLLGSVIGLGLLSKNSELVILESCGMSKARIIFSSFKMVLPVIIVFSVAAQTVFPKLQQYAENQFNYYSSEGRVSRTSWGIWLREGNSFISIRAVMSDSSVYDITRYDFDDINLKSVLTAEKGLYNGSSWDMFGVKRIDYTEDGLKISTMASDQWELYLNPERIDIFHFKSSELSVPALIDYIDYLESNNIDAGRFKAILYKLLLAPLMMILMLLIGASTVFGSMRSVNMSIRVLVGLSYGFALYISGEILPGFIVAAGLHPIIGVLLPLIVFSFITAYLLRRRA